MEHTKYTAVRTKVYIQQNHSACTDEALGRVYKWGPWPRVQTRPLPLRPWPEPWPFRSRNWTYAAFVTSLRDVFIWASPTSARCFSEALVVRTKTLGKTPGEQGTSKQADESSGTFFGSLIMLNKIPDEMFIASWLPHIIVACHITYCPWYHANIQYII